MIFVPHVPSCLLWKNLSQRLSLIREVRKCRSKKRVKGNQTTIIQSYVKDPYFLLKSYREYSEPYPVSGLTDADTPITWKKLATWWPACRLDTPVCSPLSCGQLLASSGTIARQAPLPMEFSRQEYWSGLPFPSPGGSFLTQESNVHVPHVLHWQAGSLPLHHLGGPMAVTKATAVSRAGLKEMGRSQPWN